MESTVFEVGISAVTDGDVPQHEVQNIVQAFQGAVSAALRQNGMTSIEISPSVSGVNRIPTIGIGRRQPNAGDQPNTNSAGNANEAQQHMFFSAVSAAAAAASAAASAAAAAATVAASATANAASSEPANNAASGSQASSNSASCTSSPSMYKHYNN